MFVVIILYCLILIKSNATTILCLKFLIPWCWCRSLLLWEDPEDNGCRKSFFYIDTNGIGNRKLVFKPVLKPEVVDRHLTHLAGRNFFFCRVVAGSSWIFMRELIPDWLGLGGTCWLGLGSLGLCQRACVKITNANELNVVINQHE